jgi:hypothetical protein
MTDQILSLEPPRAAFIPEPYDRQGLVKRAIGDLLSRRNQVAFDLGALDTYITSTFSGDRGLVSSSLRGLLDRRSAVAHNLGLVDAQIEYTLYDLCGTLDDPQDVEKYDGTLGVSRDFVYKHEAPVGQLVWLNDLPRRFSGANDDPGTVNGQRWGTGALIADDLFLTAGHCFQPDPRRWKVPRQNGTAITAKEIAQLMCVCFNYQKNGVTGRMQPGAVFPVLDLLECSASNLDYAIVKLGPDALGRLPGSDDLYGKLTVATKDFPEKHDILCIIQHPNGNEKKVEAGHLMDIRDGRLAYNDIGTFGGASGSPILYEKTGEIVGVHVKGGSLPIGGFNSGTTIGAIRAASKLLPG